MSRDHSANFKMETNTIQTPEKPVAAMVVGSGPWLGSVVWKSDCRRVTLYHADCMEVLPTLSGGCVYITDQPYGTGWMRGGKKAGEFVAKHEKPAWDVWSLDWLTLLNAPKRVAAFAAVGKCEELCAAMPPPALPKKSTRAARSLRPRKPPVKRPADAR